MECRECKCELTEKEERYLETLCESCSGECICDDCVVNMKRRKVDMIMQGDKFYDGNSEGVVLIAERLDGDVVHYTWGNQSGKMLITSWLKNNKLNKED